MEFIEAPVSGSGESVARLSPKRFPKASEEDLNGDFVIRSSSMVVILNIGCGGMNSKTVQLKPTINPDEFQTDTIKLDNYGFQEINIEDYSYQMCAMKSVVHTGKLSLFGRLSNVCGIE